MNILLIPHCLIFNSMRVFLIISFGITTHCNSQNQVTLSGYILDSLKKPLKNSHVLGIPKNNKLKIKFAISSKKGAYKLKLQKNQIYTLKVTHLGYKSNNKEVLVKDSDLREDFILYRKMNVLDEITIAYSPPMIVKKDTIIYKTDAFSNGNERKLIEILKNLPGVEVDRKGNVIVQGKRVTKVLVENKQFFTGDSKLAINNIPANVVDEIEILDDYSEIAFLKGLKDSNDMAMNIRLKQDRKKFVFGDLEFGDGIKERYLIHPSIFYYSPKSSVNVLGDLNNTGTKSFTLKDYLNFEGGTSKLLTDARSYFSLLNDDFAQFLVNQDFIDSRSIFGAISLTQAINAKTELTVYGMWSSTKNRTKAQTFNDYFTSDNLLENRTDVGLKDSRFGIGKLALKFKPNLDTHFTFDSYVKASSNVSSRNITTMSTQDNNVIDNTIDGDNISIRQNINWNKRFSKNHTTSAIINYNYQKASPNITWLTDQTILQGLIPIIDEETLKIIKNKKSSLSNIILELKHYWVLNNFNHIYTTFGSHLTVDNYKTSEFQILDDGSTNDFSIDEFGNNTRLKFNNLFIGVHYKFKRGIATFKPGIFYHNYSWNISQNGKVINSKGLLLPEITTKIELNNTSKITLNYGLKARFPNISQLSNRFTLINFNSIYRGSESLENELYHQAQLRYYRFSMLKDIFYNFSINYRFKEENFKNTTVIQGIDFVSTSVLSDFVDKLWNFDASLRKGIGNFKISLRGSATRAEYENPVNNVLISNKSNTYLLGGGIKTRFKDFPNIELEYTKTISDNTSGTNAKFETDRLSMHIKHDFFKDFTLKADYSFDLYNNKAFEISNSFNVADVSLFYRRDNSRWGFELAGTNLFDVAFKQRNSFSSIFISDRKTFILPRIFLFKISYSL